MNTRTLPSLALVTALCACGGPDGEPEGIGEAEIGTTACGAAKIAELLAPASSAAPSVFLGCSVTLPSPPPTITKVVIFQGGGTSGATLDCAGGTLAASGNALHIRSAKNGTTWSRPDGLTIRNCTIRGGVRVYGLGINGQGADVKASSLSLGHTERAQAAAPTNINFVNVTFDGTGPIPLYLGPGVTFTTVRNSRFQGTSNSVAIYMDAESAHNTIRDSHIATSTDRELIALDGSAYNQIFTNSFSNLSNGGIFLYRNCGEGGTIRHQSPVRNEIYGNTFFYRNYTGPNPSVFVGARNDLFNQLRPYCDDEDGFPFGSSADNHDFAKHNVIAENQIYVRTVSDMVLFSESPNYRFANRSVTPATATPPSPPGCLIELPGGVRHYLSSGRSIAIGTGTGHSTVYACNNHVLTTTTRGATVRVPFACQVSGNDDGCSGTATCPAGRTIVGSRAVCALESASLSGTALSSTAWGALRVAQTSDLTSNGECRLGGVSISEGQSSVIGVRGSSTTFHCSESDFPLGGGDCAISGELECQ